MNMNKKGFTLIELLIVVAIIAILAAIAIPQFSAYRVRGYNAAADSDLRNIKIALEAFFTDTQVYASTAACVTVVSPAVAVTCAAGGAAGAGVLIGGPATYTVAVLAAGVANGLPTAPANMIFGLSNNVWGVVTTTAGSGIDYAVYAANTSGDTIYAGESGVTTLFKSGKTAAGVAVAVSDPTQKPGGKLASFPVSATETPAADLQGTFVAI
jgi:type IV pilus assembly protein PilA